MPGLLLSVSRSLTLRLLQEPPSTRTTVVVGYAGWSPGQLEAEMEEDSWHATRALPGDVFTDDPEGLWASAVGRLGPGFRLLRTMPLDPTLN